MTANLSPQDAQASRSSPGRDLADSPTSIASMGPDTMGQRSSTTSPSTSASGGAGSATKHTSRRPRALGTLHREPLPPDGPQDPAREQGLSSYLVEAHEGYFLFAENLRRGRLVSRNTQRVLDNLKTSTFEAEDTMDATETPKPADPEPLSTATHTDIDMDMS